MIIPISLALDIATAAESLADDAAGYAGNPIQQNVDDFVTSMKSMYHRLQRVAADIGVNLETQGLEDVAALARDQREADIENYTQEIGATGDLARCLAVEVFRRQSLEQLVLRLFERVERLEISNQTTH